MMQIQATVRFLLLLLLLLAVVVLLFFYDNKFDASVQVNRNSYIELMSICNLLDYGATPIPAEFQVCVYIYIYNINLLVNSAKNICYQKVCIEQLFGDLIP